MANSHRRCSRCGASKPLGELTVRGIQAQCTERCDAKTPKPTRKRSSVRREAPTPADYRPGILSRDWHRCTWCETRRDHLHVHHINYRSGGGPDEPWNLITLCPACHDRAHSDKRRFQPLLRTYIWLLYVEGRRTTIAGLIREGVDGTGKATAA